MASVKHSSGVRKALFGTLVVLAVVLLCLWFGLILWTKPGESPI